MTKVVGLADSTESFLPDGAWVAAHDAGDVVVRHGLLSGRAFEWRFHMRCDDEQVVWCDASRFLRWRGRRDCSPALAAVPWTVSVRSVPRIDCLERIGEDGRVEIRPPGWKVWVSLDPVPEAAGT